MIKLIDILNEIGDSSAQKYDWSFHHEMKGGRDIIYYEYKFQSDTTSYFSFLSTKELDIGNGKYEMMVSFGVEKSLGKDIAGGVTRYINQKLKPTKPPMFSVGDSFNTTTNKGEMFRVMATIVDIVKDAMERNKKAGRPVAMLTFEPNKELKKTATGYKLTDQRAKFYMAYIKNHMDDIHTIRQHGNEVEVILK